MFTFKRDNIYVAALIYVDDIILLGNNNEHITNVKSYLAWKFSVKDFRPLKYLFGIEVTWTSDGGMVLIQIKYTLGILSDGGL